MNSIIIKKARLHNLKNISISIPLNQFVVVVGPSGSGKTTLIYDLIYRKSQGEKVGCYISPLPKCHFISQKATVPKNKLSLGQHKLLQINRLLKISKEGELLILDEPCAGLSVKDTNDILQKIKNIVKHGRSVILVEHSRQAVKKADYIIEFGPKSGKYGGEITFQGEIDNFKKSKTTTARYVFGNKPLKINYTRNPTSKAKAMQKKTITFSGINKNNLKDFILSFPLSSLVCIYGDIGTGKTTVLNSVYSALFKGRNAWKVREKSGVSGEILGKRNIRRSYFIDQAPISNHPTSYLVTYLRVWDSVRDLFTKSPKSKSLDLLKSDFLIKRSRDNENKFEFTDKVLSVHYKGYNVEQILNLTVDEAANLFSEVALIKRKLSFLQEVGLGYLVLGQKSRSLSGGEAQRLRLATVLSKKLSDRCIYIFDTPSKGLHIIDLPKIIKVFQKIVDKNNTILIADNKEEMIENADYTIDMNKKAGGE